VNPLSLSAVKISAISALVPTTLIFAPCRLFTGIVTSSRCKVVPTNPRVALYTLQAQSLIYSSFEEGSIWRSPRRPPNLTLMELTFPRNISKHFPNPLGFSRKTLNNAPKLSILSDGVARLIENIVSLQEIVGREQVFCVYSVRKPIRVRE